MSLSDEPARVGTAGRPPASRVLLIGWDAADWQVLDPLLAAGRMPALQSLLDRGASGRIATLHPMLSPMLWTSIATGKRADKHGVFGFVEPDGRGGVRPVSSTTRRAKALWNILSQAGRRSAVVGWYASHPAEAVHGCILSDRFFPVAHPDPEKCPLPPRSIHPESMESLARELRVHSRQLTAPQLAPFFPDQRPDVERDPRPGFLGKILAEAATVHNAATLLAADADWDLLAVYYDAIDHTGHGFMEYRQPRMAHVSDEDERIYGRVIDEMYVFHDHMLARLLELAGPQTTVLLLSDHGFQSGAQRPLVARHDPSPAAKLGGAMNPVTWHRSHGIFVAAGPGIRSGQAVHDASLLDIAPTVLALLGLPVGEDMDGAPLTQILDPELTIGRIASWEPPHPDDGVWRDAPPEETDPFAAQAAWQQLADLGYVEPLTGEAATDLAQTVFEWRSNEAQVHYAAGRMNEALDLINSLLSEREVPHLQCRAALCLIALGRQDEAMARLDAVAAQFPGMPLPHVLRSQVCLEAGDVEAALTHFGRVADLAVRQPALQTHLGAIFLAQQRPVEAAAAYQRAVALDADLAEAHDGLGLALLAQHRPEDAAAAFMRAAGLAPHRAAAHLHLGTALMRSGQVDWAIRAYEAALEQEPALPWAHECLAQLHQRFKNDALAATRHQVQAEQLRRARTVTPAVAAVDRSRLSLEQIGKGNRAETDEKKGKDETPEHRPVK